jgi:hypothetical protein
MEPITLRPFVVTGCARSATMYMASILSGLGLRVGHEVVFGPATRGFDGWRAQHGDSSWLAAPFLDQIDDALVFHQVRHPLKVVRSLVGTRFFADRGSVFLHGDDAYTRVKWAVRERLMAAGHVEQSAKGPRPHNVYRDFLREYAPEVWEPSSESERALTYWLSWTRTVVANAQPDNYARHHVERLDEVAIAGMLERVGLTVSPQHVKLAMSKVPTDMNTRRVASVEWIDLPETPLRREAEEYAARLGYVASDPSIPPAQAAT